MRTSLTVVLVLILSLAAMASPAAAARVAVLLSAKVSEYEDALSGVREVPPATVTGSSLSNRDQPSRGHFDSWDTQGWVSATPRSRLSAVPWLGMSSASNSGLGFGEVS